ncbi:MAG: ATPase, histidine kinase, gyrase and HSP90-like domain protein [Clostridia bacterium]|jgi:signal transduction histidine kinase|nr:ATPase, histidine kinase, gyrase and HSP90-like domain protein [Clostridia bacterium]
MSLINTNDFKTEIFKADYKEFEQEFEDVRINENVKRCEILALVLIILNIVLIGIDLLVYKPMRSEIIAYFYLYLSHIAMLIFLCLWLCLSTLNRKYRQFLHLRALTGVFFCIGISWCTFMGINSIAITGGITAYIICMFCFSSCFFLSPAKTLFIYLVSVSIFIAGLLFIIHNSGVLYAHIVNAIIAIILVQVTSIFKYMSFLKEFLNNKRLLQNKEALEAANQKLKEYEEVRTDFFANVSHELRTPLNVICSAEQVITSILEVSDPDHSKISKYLKIIKQNSYRLLRLINNLIDITKIDASSFKVKFVNSNIVKVVEDITMSVADFIEHEGITLIFDTETEEKIVACDPDNIERIMLNLLSNAVKYGKRDGFVFINIYLEQDSVCISVKDNGIGIEEDMQELVFERFVQVDKSFQRTREGSGIGLALVKSLVEMHGGSISVRSKIGEGSEFIIKLPDRQLSEDKHMTSTYQIEDKDTHRISVEFSDIYN